MTAEIFQIRDYQHPREICRSNERLERLAIANAVFPEATRSQGIDGMDLYDRAPSAPGKDSA
jgi:hypothetical protein